jgi:hypothetical protein
MSKIEIVKKVALSPNQRIALMDMANNGGMKERLDYNVQTVLLHLGLIEGRPRLTPAQQAKRQQGMKTQWKEIAGLVRDHNLKALRRKVETMESEAWHAEQKAWFLTPAAQEYLLNGSVTITYRDRTKQQTTDSKGEAIA